VLFKSLKFLLLYVEAQLSISRDSLVAGPLAKLTWDYVGDDDPWHSIEIRNPEICWDYGKDFQSFLIGKSRYDVDGIYDICKWLRQCDYVRDIQLFGVVDHWQHPSVFEENRKGDCEDHALWAWRKILNLGAEAEFMIGSFRGEVHAWVTFDWNNSLTVFECTEKASAGQMLRRSDEAKSDYIPYFSIDGNMVRRLYAGALSAVWKDEWI